MKKVLLVTFHFLPDIHPGAKRLGAFAKYLPLYDWQPIVLTKEIRYYHGIDETLCKELSPEVTIHRVSEWHLDVGHPKGTKSNQSEASMFSDTLWGAFRRGIYRLFYTLDYPWLFPALWQGLRLVRCEQIDVIMSSFPTPEALLVGLLLKLLTGKKWVVDFRDPWVSSSWVRFLRASSSSLRLAIDQVIEQLIIYMADAIVVVGGRMRRDLVDYYGHKIAEKIHVVYNGYDLSAFSGIEVDDKGDHRHKSFSIIHVGCWQFYRTPEYFFQALSQLLKERKYLCDKIRVDFVGEVRNDPDLEKRIPQLVQEMNLAKVVHIDPYIPYSIAMSRLIASDMALLVQPEIPDIPGATDHMVSSKIFEYMYAQKPILALVPVQGEAAEIVRTHHAGIVVSPTDVTAIKQAILRMYETFQKGELSSGVSLAEIEKFDRREQTGRLAIIFDSLTR